MTTVLFMSALIILVCIASNKLSNRFGVPALLIFIVLGMLFGSDGLFKIHFDNYVIAEQVCSFALIFIMFYGGFGTNWKMAKPVAIKATCLSTLGVVITALMTGLFCHFVLRFDPLESFLIGAVISSTDAASVFSILRSKRLNLKDGTASLLEMESGSNDPASYMLTITALGLMQGGNLGLVVEVVFSQVVYGTLMGVAIALFALLVLNKIHLVTDGFDSIFVLSIAVLSYALPTMIEGNGYLAAYLAGIIIGNSKIKNKISLVHFFDGITGLSQIVIFFLLGLLAFPSQIPAILLPSLGITLFLTFVSRPVAVMAILGPTRSSCRQQLLVSWAGLRGAASIVFAIMATVSEVAIHSDVFHIVFCVALLSVAFQGTLLPGIARKLDMIDNETNVLKTFNDYQDKTEIQLIQTHIPGGHPWVEKSIGELKPLVDTLIVLIKRKGEVVVPKGDTMIQAGDILVLSGEVYRDDDDQVVLHEIQIEAKHKWKNHAIRDIVLPDHVLMVLIKRNDGTMVIPKGETIIQQGDILVMMNWEHKVKENSFG